LPSSPVAATMPTSPRFIDRADRDLRNRFDEAQCFVLAAGRAIPSQLG
jgi:hypothetical protein